MQFYLEAVTNYYWQNNEYNEVQTIYDQNDYVREFSTYVTPGVSWSLSKRCNLIARFGRLNYVIGKRREIESSEKLPYHYLALQLNTESIFIGAELKL